MIRVAIAENHTELRTALRVLLNYTPNIELVCEARTRLEAIDCVKHHRPDVLVMDISLLEPSGLAAAKQIADLSVDTRIILVSSPEFQAAAKRMTAAGIQGFVPMGELAKSLLVAIETVHGGEQYFLE